MRSKVIYIVIIVLLLFSCSKEALKDAQDKEHDTILSYIEKLEKPYINIEGDLYRITESTGEEEEEEEEEKTRLEELTVQRGDSVYINYVLSIFSDGRGKVFLTNIEQVAIEENIATPVEFIPWGVKYGSTAQIRGIYLALEESIEGYSYSVVIPFDYGYGDIWHGTIEAYSTLFFEYEVLKIKK